jgi:hypothetical protein
MIKELDQEAIAELKGRIIIVNHHDAKERADLIEYLEKRFEEKKKKVEESDAAETSTEKVGLKMLRLFKTEDIKDDARLSNNRDVRAMSLMFPGKQRK